MSHAEVGLYIRCLSRIWLDGSIPIDPKKLARLFGAKSSETSKLFAKISHCFEKKGPETLTNRRLEIERKRQIEYSDSQKEKGRKGGISRSDRQAAAKPLLDKDGVETVAPAKPELRVVSQPAAKHMRARFSSSFSLSFYLATLDKDEAGKEVVNPPLAFAEWFVNVGLDLGAIPADRALDLDATIYRQDISDAAALLDSYGPAEVEKRARLFFAACVTRRIRSAATISRLRECWDWEPVISERRGVRGPGFDQLTSREKLAIEPGWVGTPPIEGIL